MAEGAGMLVIEEYERAKARGAKIYCELAGFGCTGDAYHITAPDASASGPSRGMMLAMQDAGLTPADVDYINAHGTSTVLNDAGETKAIKLALGEERAPQIAVSSTKSMTGHLLGAAGGVESVVCALAIRDGVLPPPTNQLHDPRPGVRSGLRAQRRPQGEDPRLPEQFAGVRRPQRDPLLQGHLKRRRRLPAERSPRTGGSFFASGKVRRPMRRRVQAVARRGRRGPKRG
jgi:hypothetical protein